MIFCQMVDDTSAVTEEFHTEEDPEKERLRLFAIDRELATCENTTNELVLARAREEIKWSLWRVCADTEKEMQSRYHQELELLALGELHLAMGSVQRRKCWWRCPRQAGPRGRAAKVLVPDQVWRPACGGSCLSWGSPSTAGATACRSQTTGPCLPALKPDVAGATARVAGVPVLRHTAQAVGRISAAKQLEG